MRKYARIVSCDHCKKPIGPEEMRHGLHLKVSFLDSCMLAARMDVCGACVKSKPMGALLKRRRAERAEPNETLKKRYPANYKKKRDVALKLVVAG